MNSNGVSSNRGAGAFGAARARRSCSSTTGTSFVKSIDFDVSAASTRGRDCAVFSGHPAVEGLAGDRHVQRIGTQLAPRVLHARAQGERHRHPRSVGAERRKRRRGRELGRHVGNGGSGTLPGAHGALGRDRGAVAGEAQVERPVLLALQQDGASADLAFDLPALLADRKRQGDLAPPVVAAQVERFDRQRQRRRLAAVAVGDQHVGRDDSLELEARRLRIGRRGLRVGSRRRGRSELPVVPTGAVGLEQRIDALDLDAKDAQLALEQRSRRHVDRGAAHRDHVGPRAPGRVAQHDVAGLDRDGRQHPDRQAAVDAELATGRGLHLVRQEDRQARRRKGNDDGDVDRADHEPDAGQRDRDDAQPAPLRSGVGLLVRKQSTSHAHRTLKAMAAKNRRTPTLRIP